MLKQTNINIMSKSCNEKINKTKYDNLGKPIKQTSFTVKNLRGNFPKKQFTIVKRSVRFSTKLLSLDSKIPVDEITVETFYRFRTSKLFKIWTPSFLHGSQYVTNTPTWKKCWLQSFSFHQQWRSRSTWLQNSKAQRHSNFFQRK